MDHEHRAADALAQSARLLLGRPRRRCLQIREDQRLRAPFEPPRRPRPRSASSSAAPGSAVRRRTRGSRGSPAASSGRCTSPSPRPCRAAPGRGRAGSSGARAGSWARTERSPPRRARPRVGRGEHERPAAAVADAADQSVLRPARLEDGAAVGDVLPPRVRRCIRGPIRAAVAAWIEDDGAKVAGEVRDLPLPQPRVRDRRGRKEQERRLRVAVGLPEDADAVPLDVALLIGIDGAALLAACGVEDHGSRSTNSWTSRLTATGSRACGKCPEPRSVTSWPPVASASARPRACEWSASSSP